MLLICRGDHERCHKRNNVKVKVRHRELSNICRDVIAIISATKMCHVGREFSDRKIVHAFIKSGRVAILIFAVSMSHQRMFCVVCGT